MPQCLTQLKQQRRDHKNQLQLQQRLRRNAPEILIDPDGEGIYVLAEPEATNYPGNALLTAASHLGFTDHRDYKKLEVESLWMDPDPDTEDWIPQTPSKRLDLRLNLSLGHRPALYLYCTPKPNAQ